MKAMKYLLPLLALCFVVSTSNSAYAFYEVGVDVWDSVMLNQIADAEVWFSWYDGEDWSAPVQGGVVDGNHYRGIFANVDPLDVVKWKVTLVNYFPQSPTTSPVVFWATEPDCFDWYVSPL